MLEGGHEPAHDLAYIQNRPETGPGGRAVAPKMCRADRAHCRPARSLPGRRAADPHPDVSPNRADSDGCRRGADSGLGPDRAGGGGITSHNPAGRLAGGRGSKRCADSRASAPFNGCFGASPGRDGSAACSDGSAPATPYGGASCPHCANRL